MSVKPPLGYCTPLGYSLNDAPGSPMSPDRGPMGGGAFIVAMRGTVYVTPGPYLPIAKSNTFFQKVTLKEKITPLDWPATGLFLLDQEPTLG